MVAKSHIQPYINQVNLHLLCPVEFLLQFLTIVMSSWTELQKWILPSEESLVGFPALPSWMFFCLKAALKSMNGALSQLLESRVVELKLVHNTSEDKLEVI
uniref:Uncharacterized protein n=1 Tax=Physcomitrium patens TaxID=3218 RepID=A0A2K1IFP2_PHYPA|nr:hypothetical protein PHYPA_028687 [Physcomitrium patens]